MTNATGASLFTRLASLLYESLLTFAVLAASVMLPHVLLGLFAHKTAGPAILWGHLILVLYIYFVWFWLNGGQTLAMRTWRIRVVAHDDRPLAVWNATLRFMLAWPSIGLFGIGILWALIDRDKLFLHDRLAGTRLIHQP